MLLDLVVYTYAHIHLYSLMYLVHTALFQTLFEVEWTAKLVLFTIKVPVPPTYPPFWTYSVAQENGFPAQFVFRTVSTSKCKLWDDFKNV